MLASAALLLPVLTTAQGLDPFRFPKVLILRTAAILLVVAYGVRSAWSKPPDWRAHLKDRLSLILLAIWLWCGIAAAFSPDPGVSWWGWADVTAALILFVCSRDYVRSTGSSSLFWLLLIPGIINSGALMLQSAGLWHPMVTLEAFQTLPHHDRVLLSRAAFLGNRDDVGLYLLIPLSTAISLMIGHSRDRRRFVAAGSAVLFILAGILLSSTLTAIALAVPMTASFLLVRSRASRSGRRRLLVIVSVLVILAVGAAWLSGLVQESDSVPERLTRYSEGLREGRYVQATGSRILPAMVCLHLVKSSLLFGAGPGRFPLEFTETAELLRQQHPKLLLSSGTEWFDMAHNDFLESAAEAGMPVVILMMAAIIVFTRRALASLPEDGGSDWRQWIRFGAGVLVPVLSIAALVLFPLQIAAVYGTLAIATGGALGAAEDL